MIGNQNNIWKVVFLVIDVTWKLFCQTGNIEAYLLLRELEDNPNENSLVQNRSDEILSFDTEM